MQQRAPGTALHGYAWWLPPYVAFLRDHSRKGEPLLASTLSATVSALVSTLAAKGAEPSQRTRDLTDRTLRGCKVADHLDCRRVALPHGAATGQAPPLLGAHLRAMERHLADDMLDVVVFTFAVLAHSALLRISDYATGLRWEAFSTGFKSLFLFNPKSRDPCYVLVPSHGPSGLRPRLLLRLLRRMHGRTTGPAFATGSNGLTIRVFTDRLRDLAMRAGVPYASDVTPHSLRRGGATDYIARGVNLLWVAQQGRWKDLRSLAPYSSPNLDQLDHALDAKPTPFTLAEPSHNDMPMESVASKRPRLRRVGFANEELK